MAESLFSPSWHRVAELRPRLRDHARVHRHLYRGQVWYVLQDPSKGENHRFNAIAHEVIGRMDGSRTVQQVWDDATAHLGDDAPTQDETIQILGQLHAADVLQCNVTPDAEEILRRQQRHQRRLWQQTLLRPLALRVPLWDPDRFLDRLAPFAGPVFGPAGLLIWSAVVAAAVLLTGTHWSELTAGFADRVLAPQNLLLLGLTYPVVKALHELGHALATKFWGGEVHQTGVMFLVLMPVPYTDASASSAFPDKRRRIIVGAAGIMVELFLAALSLFVWLSVEPGAVRTMAYNVMVIGGISTLLFNGNPLLRFDGYYVLEDAVEIPNLASRSNKHLLYLMQRYLFGVHEARSPATAPGEKSWFVAYGLAAFVYRLFIIVAIVLFLAGKFFVLGVALAVWAVIGQIVLPVTKGLAFLFSSPRLDRNRSRAVAVTGALSGALVCAALFVPVPLLTQAQGVIWPPDKAQVRAGAAGFIRAVLAAPNAPVKTGDALIELEDPLLEARAKVLKSQLKELSVRYQAERTADRVQAGITEEEMAAVKADLADARERLSKLVIRSRTDGVFVLPDAEDLVDRYVQEGELLGFVLSGAARSARVVVTQRDIGVMRRRDARVQVRLSEDPARTYSAVVRREVPAGNDRLPSKALGTAGGGKIPIDPRDESGVQALQKVFQFELGLPESAPARYIGARVHVRFDHGTEPLARQWYRAIRQLFLGRFGV